MRQLNDRMSCIPILPRRPLFWKNIPLFHVSQFPNTFCGVLYFVLGQGLGDHVNGFRILHEIQKLFPKAVFIVYADRRWADLVVRLDGIEVRWYPKASDVLSKEGTNNPYDWAHDSVRSEILSKDREAYLAYAHFPMPDRHARRESTLEATARTVGLSLRERARPFLPVTDEDSHWAHQYLDDRGINAEEYVVIAPFTWPHKMWSKENFSDIISRIWRTYRFRSIVISYPEIGDFDNEGVVCAYDLSLGQIAGLLKLSKLYIGLDSGISHMAAFFDLPMSVVFVERSNIPFEVAPLSPFVQNIVESFFFRLPAPRVETVWETISRQIESGSLMEDKCPVCHSPMRYVAFADRLSFRKMCVCGLTILEKNVASANVPFKHSLSFKVPFPVKLLRNSSDLNEFALFLGDTKSCGQEFQIRVNHDYFFNLASCFSADGGHDLTFSVDSLLSFMESCGFTFRRMTKQGDYWLIDFSRCGDPGNHVSPEKKVDLYWGGVVMRISPRLYFKWFSFESWGQPNNLVGVVKSLQELGMAKKDWIQCALASFSAERSFRSFRWLVKVIFFSLFQKKENTHFVEE